MAAVSGIRSEYLSRLATLAEKNRRYEWLSKYLYRDTNFVTGHLNPVQQGSTRTIVADFSQNPADDAQVQSFVGAEESKDLNEALTTRTSTTKVRLIFVTSISGVREEVREQQLSRPDCKHAPDILDDKDCRANNAPRLTRPRFPGMIGTHPIAALGHSSYLPDPDTLIAVASALNLDPYILLCWLDQNEHLSYRPKSLYSQYGRVRQLSIGFDHENNIAAFLIPGPLHSSKEQGNDGCTVLLLASEDNCLGVDFNPNTSEIRQLLRRSTQPLADSFEAKVLAMNTHERLRVLRSPEYLIWLYTANFAETISCHIELCRREWSALYEPHADSSAIYGDSDDRDFIRRTKYTHSSRLEYLKRSVESLDGFEKYSTWQSSDRRTPSPRRQYSSEDDEERDVSLEYNYGDYEKNDERLCLSADFSHFVAEMKALKSLYGQFLEQQINKISLHESRRSASEARNVNRLSYLAFVFGPLSLASSFFSTNIQPLGGKVPLWIFILTSLAILAFSLFALYLSGIKMVRDLFGRVVALMTDIFQWGKGVLCCVIERPPDGFGGDRYTLPQIEPEKSKQAEPTIASGTKPLSTPSTPSQSSSPYIFNRANNSVSRSTNPGPSVVKSPWPQTSNNTRIPMNDKSRRRRIEKEEKTTSAAKAPYREELSDSYSTDANTMSQPQPPHVAASYDEIAYAASKPGKKTPLPPILERAPQRTFRKHGEDSVHPNINQGAPPEGSRAHPEHSLAPVLNETSSTTHNVPGERHNIVDLDQATYDEDESRESRTSSSDVGFSMTAKEGIDELCVAAYDEDESRESRTSSSDVGFSMTAKEGIDELCVAAENGHLRLVQLLLPKLSYPYSNFQKDTWRHQISSANPLSLAAFGQHDAVMHELIKWGVRKTHGGRSRFRKNAINYLLMAAIVDICKKQDLAVLKQFLLAIRCAKSQVVVVFRQVWEFDEEYCAGLDQIAQGCADNFLDAVTMLKSLIVDQQKFASQVNNCLETAILTRNPSLSLLQKLLDEGASINHSPNPSEESERRDFGGFGPLHLACKFGSKDMVRYLLQRGANPSLVCKHRVAYRCPLAIAASRNDLSIIDMLIEAGANINGPNIMRSASDSIDVMKRLIDAGAIVNIEQVNRDAVIRNADDQDDPLEFAAARGNLDMVRFLLGAGINLDAVLKIERKKSRKKSRGEIAFESACNYGREDTALLLLDAMVQNRSPSEISAFYTAVGKESLGRSVYTNMPRALECLLKAGVEIDNPVMYLCSAAGEGHLKILTLLLEYGGKKWINDSNNFGTLAKSPMHQAIADQKLDTAQMLLDWGGDLGSLASYDRETPLHLAAKLGYVAGVHFLLKRGAKISAVDDDGQTPLHAAARAGKLETITELLKHGANINAKDSAGWTPVHRAAWNNYGETVKLLEDAGADMGATTRDGLTVQALLLNNVGHSQGRGEDSSDGYNSA